VQTKTQRQRVCAFAADCADVCGCSIYGDDWPRVSERVLKEFGIVRLRPEVLVQTPRRFGKTVSIAMFVAAMLLSCPDIRVCVFVSSNKKQLAIAQLATCTWSAHAFCARVLL